MLLKELVEKNRVAFYEKFPTWEEAVVASCKTLLVDGSIEQSYVDSVVNCIKEFGPYIIIAPHIAIPHSQKGAVGVNDTAIAFMKVEEPVHFQENNPEKDARLFFTLAAIDNDKHFANMQKLAELLFIEGFVEDLLKAKTPQDLLDIDKKYEMLQKLLSYGVSNEES